MLLFLSITTNPYNMYMYLFQFQNIRLLKQIAFLIVTGPGVITKDTPTPEGNRDNDHSFSNEQAQHHDYSLRSYISMLF